MTNSISVDDIAPPTGGNAWKPEIGDTVKGIIRYVGKNVRENQFTGFDEESLRIDLETDSGDIVNVYCVTNTNVNGDGYAKRDAKAVSAAVRAAGESTLTVGGILAVKRVDDVPTERGAAKAFVAEYQAPTPETTADGDDGAVTGLI